MLVPMRENNMVATVEENKQQYTAQQFEDARCARKLYHILGAPVVENFKKILKQNIIKNCPITIEHVNMVEHIFWEKCCNPKRKSTRPRLPRVMEDHIEIPHDIKTQ